MRSRRFPKRRAHPYRSVFRSRFARGARHPHLRPDDRCVWSPASHRGNHEGADRALHVDWRSARLSRLHESGRAASQGHAHSDSRRCATADRRGGRWQGLAGGEEREDPCSRHHPDGDRTSAIRISTGRIKLRHANGASCAASSTGASDHRARGRPLHKSLRVWRRKRRRIRFCSPIDPAEASAGQIYNVGDERVLTLRQVIE